MNPFQTQTNTFLLGQHIIPRSFLHGIWMISLLCMTSGCANSSSGDVWQRSLTPDPQLQGSPTGFGVNTPQANLPSPLNSPQDDIPAEVPLYPNAKLITTLTIQDKTIFPFSQVATSNIQDAMAKVSHWSTTDSVDLIRDFFQKTFQNQGWERLSRTPTSPPDSLIAQRNEIQVIVSTPPRQLNQSGTEETKFTIHFLKLPTNKPTNPPSSPVSVLIPQPGSPEFIGPLWNGVNPIANLRKPSSQSPDLTSPVPQSFSDLSKAPQSLRPYIQDLADLGLLITDDSGVQTKSPSQKLFRPNQPITRREFARWLATVNNRLNAARPGRQIRLAVETTRPSYQDIPRNDADFAVIQGLAEAGILPSSLTGDNTTVLFRPNIPLVREGLLTWKVPLDVRQRLPLGTLESVQQTWGFQDAPRITSGALKFILADYQNGELSNIRRAFGFTTLLQPKRPVTRSEAAAALWYFGTEGDGISAADVKAEISTQSE